MHHHNRKHLQHLQDLERRLGQKQQEMVRIQLVQQQVFVRLLLMFGQEQQIPKERQLVREQLQLEQIQQEQQQVMEQRRRVQRILLGQHQMQKLLEFQKERRLVMGQLLELAQTLVVLVLPLQEQLILLGLILRRQEMEQQQHWRLEQKTQLRQRLHMGQLLKMVRRRFEQMVVVRRLLQGLRLKEQKLQETELLHFGLEL